MISRLSHESTGAHENKSNGWKDEDVFADQKPKEDPNITTLLPNPATTPENPTSASPSSSSPSGWEKELTL